MNRLQERKRRWRSQVSGELFVPSSVLAEMRMINNGIAFLKAAAERDEKVPEDLRARFNEFALSWQEFFADNKGWLKRALNTTFDAVKDFRRQYEFFRQEFAKAGIKTAAPPLSAPGFFDRTGALFQLGIAAAIGGLIYWAFTKKE